MRWIALVGLGACAELPPLPDVDAGPDWTCDDGFIEAVQACEASECSGFMAMNSLVDAENVRFVSNSAHAVVKFGDTDSIETIELHSTTDYFRSVVTISSIGLHPGGTPIPYRVLTREFAEAYSDAVTLQWDASNSEIPQMMIGVSGLSSIDVRDDWVRVTFLVTDQHDELLQGCAYIPLD